MHCIVGQRKGEIYVWNFGLADNPRLGRMVPEIGRPDIREILVAPYRIFYRVRPGTCQVLSIRHARQRTTPCNFTS